MTIANAVVLANGVRAQAAAERVVGLGVAERSVRALLRGGVRRIWLVGDDTVLPADLQPCVTVVASDEAEALAEQVADDGGTTLIVPGDAIVHPEFAAVLGAREGVRGRAQVVGRGDHVVICGKPAGLPMADLLTSVGDASRTLVERGVAERWDATESPFVLPLSGPVTKHEATWALLRLNWRPHDGIVARLVNKHISVRLSARLAQTSITPNQMTTVAFVCALVGIAFTSVGSYWAVVLGAGMVQVQSILDGCDGELARLRFQSSRWGAWYDTVVDDVIGVLWVAGMGVGMWRATGSGWWLYLGVGSGCLSSITIAYLYTVILRGGGNGHQDFLWWFEEDQQGGGGGHEEAPSGSGPAGWAKYALRRDFYVLLFFLLALLGLLSAMTLLASAGAVAGFVVAMIQLGKRGFRLTPVSH